MPIPRLPPAARRELSAFQRGLWALVQASPADPFYNASRVLRLRGPLDLPRFARALAGFVARHDILRASFVATASGPAQCVAAEVAVPLPLEDISALPPSQRRERMRAWLDASAWAPFDLEQAPLLRCRAFRTGADEHQVVITAHHIISDGASGKLMVEELAALYHALGGVCRPEGPAHAPLLAPPALQYHDFSAWQNARLAAGVLAASEDYWCRRLAGALPFVEIPADRRRPPIASHRGAQHRRHLSAALSGRLKELRRRQGTTQFRLILAALDVLLLRLSGETDVIVGSPVACRTHPALRDVQGFFVNMLALRVDLAGDPGFADALARVTRGSREDIEHKDYPFDQLVQRLNPPRHPGRPPIFDVVLSMREPGFASELVAGELALSQDEVPFTRVARYGVTLIVAETREGIRLTFEYAVDLFDTATVHRLAAMLEQLLAAVAADVNQRLSQLPLLSAAERAAVLREWNDSAWQVAGDALLHHRFAAAAAADPAATAVVCGRHRLTFGELDDRSNRLAHHLVRRGVRAGEIVGILLERSPDLLVAVLAVLKAGGAYLPLAVQDSPARLARIAVDSAMRLVVTRTRHRKLLDIGTLLVDRQAAAIAGEPAGAPMVEVVPDSLAYVLYTSGSTGTPKGVMVSHAAATNYLAWCRDAYHLGSGRRTLLHSSATFDLTLTALLGSLLAGGELHLLPEGRELAAIATQLRRAPVGMLKVTPAHLEALRRSLAPRLAARVEILVVGGEALSGEALQLFRTSPSPPRVFNEYGPTEATVGCAVHVAAALGSGPVPIGRPLANARLHVLGAALEPLPIGACGELYIGGAGLARGYVGRADATAERFLPDPWSEVPGQRLYRSGDRVRRLSDGSLEYVGRCDRQVKIRGVRVEPAEVEAALCRIAAVQEAAVVVREEQGGERWLVACVAPRPGAVITAAELRSGLAACLPAAMVPARYLVLEALPVTPGGKVDRAALTAAAARASAPASVYVPPRDEVEWELAGLWGRLLRLPAVGVLDDFFDLGGHSLLAVSLVAEVTRRFGGMVDVASLVQDRTISAMRARLRGPLAERRGVTVADRHLVTLRAGDPAAAPLIFLHTQRGGVFAYHALASALAVSCPIYGLRAPGLEEGEEPVDSIPELAAIYLRELRELPSPRHPWRLAGWSFGGAVAYEMARQAESAGEEVDLLALIDTCLPGEAAAGELVLDSMLRIGRFFFQIEEEALAGLDERAACELMLGRGRELQLVSPSMTVDALARQLRVVGAHARALADYRPAGTVGAGLVLFLADRGSQVTDPDRWQRHTRGGLAVVQVPGPHHDMTFPPAVSDLAVALARALGGGADGAVAAAAATAAAATPTATQADPR